MAGQLDGGDAGRAALGAVRTHAARHRHGLRGPDPPLRPRREALVHGQVVIVHASRLGKQEARVVVVSRALFWQKGRRL